MKKRRKVLSVMLCAAMIASLAACGSKGDDKKSSDDGGKVKLTFSTSVYVEEPHQKAIDALLEAYSKKEPNVEIEILGAGYDGYWDNITTEILSNNESDMIQVYPEDIKTQEDFRKACKKFTDDGKYAMGVVSGTHAFTVSEWNRLIARPVSNGLYFPNGESEPYTADNVNINAPENVWAAQWWQDFILKDKAAKLVTDKKDSREMFWNGDVPFNMDGPWFVGMCKERDESLMDDIGIIPQFDVVYDGTTYKPNPTNYPLVTMISKNCKHPKEAYAFLEWMTTDEAQKIIADCGMIPSNTDYSTSDEYIQNHELEHKIVEFMQNNYTDLVADPNISQLGEISQIMLDAAQKMFSEQAADVQEEMDSAQKQVEEVMSRDAE